MKRKVFLAAVAICLIAVIAGGTLAYFTGNSKTITNKFMVASSDPLDPTPTDPDKVFSVTVTEEKESSDGEYNSQTGEYEYKEMLPGSSYKKNPIIKNTGAYDQWIRATVTFSKKSAWEAAGYGRTADGKKDLFTSLVTGYTAGNWEAGTDSPKVKGDTIEYTFFYKEGNGKLAPTNTATLFTGVTIPKDIDVAKMTALNGFTVKVKADAIQAANTGASAKATFESKSPVYWTEPV